MFVQVTVNKILNLATGVTYFWDDNAANNTPELEVSDIAGEVYYFYGKEACKVWDGLLVALSLDWSQSRAALRESVTGYQELKDQWKRRIAEVQAEREAAGLQKRFEFEPGEPGEPGEPEGRGRNDIPF